MGYVYFPDGHDYVGPSKVVYCSMIISTQSFVFLQSSVVVPMGQDICEAGNNVDRTTHNEGCHKTFCTDKLSRLLFPVAFLIFNVIYWPVCILG